MLLLVQAPHYVPSKAVFISRRMDDTWPSVVEFARLRPTRNHMVLKWQADGTCTLKGLVGGGGNFGDLCRLSPDGKWLALTGLRYKRPTLYLIPWGSKKATALTLNATQIEWSPDSKWLAALCQGNAGSTAVVVSPNGRSWQSSLSHPLRIQWSQDSKWVVGASTGETHNQSPEEGSKMQNAISVETTTSAYSLTTGRTNNISVTKSLEMVLGQSMTPKGTQAYPKNLTLWTQHVPSYTWSTRYGVVEIEGRTGYKASYDRLFSRDGTSQITRRETEFSGTIVEAKAVGPSLVGYASDGTIFPNQPVPAHDGMRLELFNLNSRSHKTWVILNRRSNEGAVHWEAK